MSALREVLDKLHSTLVTVEETVNGRLRLVAGLDEYPVTSEITELCREHKPLLLEYVRWEAEADKLLIDSTNRLSELWPQGCTALDDYSAWDDLEHRIHEAYWAMNMASLVSAIEAREAYARELSRLP